MSQSDNGHIFILGITGGIGVGKSTVTSILEALGAKIIDCDKVSRALSEREDIIQDITTRFGDKIVTKHNKLDRKALAKIVFNDKEKLELLNSILHKKVVEEIYKRLKFASPKDIFVIDAPIPVKEGFLDTCHEIWTITTPKEIRLKRVILRDNTIELDVLSRINSQLDDESYIKIADKVIYNDGDIMSLKKKVEMNWANLTEIMKG